MSGLTARDDKESDTLIRGLLDSGMDIAGGAVGGALGFLAGGPMEAALLAGGGVVAAGVLKHVGTEVSERLLGPREKARIGGVLAIAAAEIEQRLRTGDVLRDDGFFRPAGKRRSAAEEVAESVLLKSQREPEERKLPYMGYLLAAVSFDDQVSAELAHQMTKIAEQLTYRQLCLLKLAVVKGALELREDDYRGESSFPRDLMQVLYECLDLYVRGLISFGGSVAFGPTDVAPGRMTVQGLGAEIFNLMKLKVIPAQDVMIVAAQLK